ncbi:MAG: flagellar biosynthetic protein FliQ [Planctomycetota bacterium]
MEIAAAIELARQTLFTALAMAGPILGCVLIVAFCLAILQTVLNLQEQTITVVPKIITAILVAILLAPWVLRSLIDFTVPLLRDILAQRM